METKFNVGDRVLLPLGSMETPLEWTITEIENGIATLQTEWNKTTMLNWKEPLSTIEERGLKL